MQSVYKITGKGKEAAYTTAKIRKGGEQFGKIEDKDEWQKHFPKEQFGKETEDYIFVSKGDFKVVCTLPIPEYDTIGENLLLNWRHPSDHFDIMVDLIPKRKSASYLEFQKPKSLAELFEDKRIKVGTEVIYAGPKDGSWTIRRNVGDVGTVIFSRQGKISVNWSGKDRDSTKFKIKATAPKQGHTNCFVSHIKNSIKRRRMAQREFSNRRDSPVMVRLLQKIIDAQDD